MEHRFASTILGLAAVVSLLLSIRPVTAVDWDHSYCSNLNTGSDDDVYNWPWQSNGNCTGHCNEQGTYAFAVIQYTNCWCSDYIPGETTDLSNCNVECPGFPDEQCGDKDKDTFIYVKMDGEPSGTQGGSQPTSTAAESSAPQSTEAPSTEAPSSQAPSSQAPTSEEPSTTKKPSSSDDSPSTTEEPMTVPTVMTESGVVVTRTIVTTPTSASSLTENDGDKTNVGAIAGGVAGGIIGLLAIVGGIIFVLWRKKRQQAQQQNGQEGATSGISRNVSTMSRAGLLGGRSEKTPPPIVTTFGSQRSRTDNESISPVTPSTRRYSQPILVDSRLNPNAVLTFHGASLSRESLGSIDDSRDYGRQLNVRNPDP